MKVAGRRRMTLSREDPMARSIHQRRREIVPYPFRIFYDKTRPLYCRFETDTTESNQIRGEIMRLPTVKREDLSPENQERWDRIMAGRTMGAADRIAR